DRARPGHVRGDPRDAPQLVFGHDRAAGEAPDAAVNHADAEARRAGAATAAPRAAASPAAAARLGVGSAVGVDAGVDAAREADVGVGAAGALRFGEHDVGETFEGRGERVAFRGLRDQLANEIARGNEQACGTGVFQKVATTGAHTGSCETTKITKFTKTTKKTATSPSATGGRRSRPACAT